MPRSWYTVLAVALTLAACQNPPRQALTTAERVDIERYMGDWYVIAHIPPFLTDEAYNAVESYRRADDGTIATVYRYRDGGFEAETQTLTATGFVGDDPSNAIWGMQFVWPIKADYRIIYLEPDYSITVIGRNKRDYLWIMARQPSIPETKYRELVAFAAARGYDPDRIRKVPQRHDS